MNHASDSRAVDTQAAKEPQREQDDQYQPYSATEPSSTILPVAVIAAATAEQQNEQHDD